MPVQIAQIEDPSLYPPAYHTTSRPPSLPFTDTSVYELHIRDFSASDPSVPVHKRGKYLAFAEPHSLGVEHLRKLKEAGLTHVHLLPSYDYGSVPERPEDQKVIQVWLSRLLDCCVVLSVLLPFVVSLLPVQLCLLMENIVGML